MKTYAMRTNYENSSQVFVVIKMSNLTGNNKTSPAANIGSIELNILDTSNFNLATRDDHVMQCKRARNAFSSHEKI